MHINPRDYLAFFDIDNRTQHNFHGWKTSWNEAKQSLGQICTTFIRLNIFSSIIIPQHKIFSTWKEKCQQFYSFPSCLFLERDDEIFISGDGRRQPEFSRWTSQTAWNFLAHEQQQITRRLILAEIEELQEKFRERRKASSLQKNSSSPLLNSLCFLFGQATREYS